LRGKIPEVKAEPSIKEDRCLQITNSGRLSYERNKSLRIEILEGRTRGGDFDHRFKETGVSISSTPEYFHMGKVIFES
jgi:hypothetical protein